MSPPTNVFVAAVIAAFPIFSVVRQFYASRAFQMAVAAPVALLTLMALYVAIFPRTDVVSRFGEARRVFFEFGFIVPLFCLPIILLLAMSATTTYFLIRYCRTHEPMALWNLIASLASLGFIAYFRFHNGGFMRWIPMENM